jgi:hypothetical protein
MKEETQAASEFKWELQVPKASGAKVSRVGCQGWVLKGGIWGGLGGGNGEFGGKGE